MPFVPVPQTAKVTFVYEWGLETTAVNTLHFSSLDADNAGELTALVDALVAWWDLELQPLVGTAWSLAQVRALYIGAAGGAEIVANPLLSGTLAQPSMPANNTIAISLRTGFSGRSNRGRLYHVGLTESQVTGNYVDGVTEAALIAAYTAIVAAVTPMAWTWGIASYQQDGVALNPGVFKTITNVLTVNGQVDHMNSRLPRGH